MVDLKDLPPEERIKQLNELKEKLKKEKEQLDKEEKETEQLIKESQIDANEKRIKQDEIPIEEIRAENIDDLASEEAKEIYRQKRFVRPLEQEVQNPENTEYINHLAQIPATELYQRAYELQKEIQESPTVDQYQAYSLYTLQGAMQEKRRDIREGIYTTSDEVVRQLDTAAKIIEDMVGKYKTD
ncbi:MAG: hypothetical protein ACLFP2_04640 [Candidatus Woesearchaeota archaeon]